MLKTIIFDLGRVIVPFDFDRGFQLMAERTGLTVADVRQRIQALDCMIPYESGQLSNADFVRLVGGAVGREFDVADFQLIWGSIFFPETLIPESLLQSLKAAGYRLVLLSNTNDLHFSFIQERYPLLRHFDEYVLSHRVGALKPDPRIYAAALAAAQCDGAECFFTDDIPAYVEGARAAGIHAEPFTGLAPLLDHLRRFRVPV